PYAHPARSIRSRTSFLAREFFILAIPPADNDTGECRGHYEGGKDRGSGLGVRDWGLGIGRRPAEVALTLRSAFRSGGGIYPDAIGT
ncbi:MAG: hypothetical protein WAO35_28695, partial [Terriglobia bacterium]